MKGFLNGIVLILIALDSFCQVNINPDPEGPPWITGGVPLITPEIQQQIDAIPQMRRNSFIDPPEFVDNSQWKFMPPIFLQTGNCCAQASGVAYVFTYEMNWLRDKDASDEQNQFPTHFTYNFLNDGSQDAGSVIDYGWDIIQQNGCPNIPTFGSMDAYGDPTFWMTGSDNYYAALLNRVDYYETIDLTDPEVGLAYLKQWLFNHNDDDEVYGGLASFTTNMPACDIQVIQPPLPEFGKTFVNEYNNPQGMHHQLTIVGYDDNICLWDINQDGQYTTDIDVDGDNDYDLFDYERGAFKVANSWDIIWPNEASGGFVYWPYRFLAYSSETGHDCAFLGRVAYIVYPKESYEPELTLKMQFTHPERNKIKISVYYGENANSTPPPPEDYDLMESYLAFLYSGGNYPLLGDNNYSPMSLTLDYNYFFSTDDVGKLYLPIAEKNNIGGYDGEVQEFSLVDYRWGETFELMSEFQNSEINSGYNWFYIDYDLIPHENPITNDLFLSSNMVSRFSPTVSNNAILTVDDNVIIDMYNSELTIEEGCSLIIGDNAIFQANRGISKIKIHGNVQIGSNVTFTADEESTIELYLGSDQINISNCHFQNCVIESQSSPLSITISDFSNSFIYQCVNDLEVSHSKFFHSSIMASNPTMGCLPIDNAANITDCYFQTAYNEAHSIIELYGYKQFNILTDTIDNVNNPSNTCHGISIHYSGSVEPNSEHMIADNLIYCSFNGCDNDLSGITLYSSIADIQNNYIYFNQIGIQSLNYSRLYINGNSNANFEDQTQRIINNGLLQLYASRDAFPLEFHWNSVYGDVSDCFIFHDVDMSLQPPDVDVANNYWGPVFDPDVNLCPERHYDFEPVWQLRGGQLGISAAQQLFLTGINQIADSSFSQAKSTFQQVVVQYPDEEPAKNALKEILYLEPLAGNDFEGLKTWYLTDSVIVNNEILIKIAENLANKCDEKLENYPEAIDWYESVIEDPESLEDSIFAIIDLEHLYWQMGIDTNLRSASYIGRLSQFRPESFNAFREHKDELLSLLHKSPGRQSNQNEDLPIETSIADNNLLWSAPNPFSGKTQIHFYLMMESDIQLNVFNNVGQMIYSIVETDKQKGAVKFEFDASDLNSGVYFYQVVVNGVPTGCQKMIIL